ncbi:hypothetical protein [Lusitaniella coriacea]|uniref:hypothetical protein n=1 Tax=Lusitaniella coriacea TaxID=1983105 RepID=UPI003CF14045
MIPIQLTYRERLQPWCVVRHLPNLQRLTVARFSRRNDAEAYLIALRRLMPSVNHIIIFSSVPIASDKRDRVPATCN